MIDINFSTKDTYDIVQALKSKGFDVSLKLKSIGEDTSAEVAKQVVKVVEELRFSDAALELLKALDIEVALDVVKMKQKLKPVYRGPATVPGVDHR